MKFFVLLTSLILILQAHAETSPETPGMQSLPVPATIPSSEMPSQGEPPLSQEKASLTLAESISLALKTATQVLKAQSSADLNGAQLLQSYAQFLPNLGIQGSYSYMNGNNYFTTAAPTYITTNNFGATYSVTSSLNLFNGFSDYSNLRSSLLKKDAADLSLFRAKQAIVLDVTQSFLQVILDDQLVDIAKKSFSLSQERQKLLEEQTRVGVRNLADLFRQQAQTSADEFSLANALNKERSDEILLLRKLRLDLSKNYQLVPPKIEEGQADQRFHDENDLIRTALEQRADLKSSDHLAEAGEWDVRNSQGAYLPRLDLGFNLNSAGKNMFSQTVNGVNVVPPAQQDIFTQLRSQSYYTVGLTLTFNIFDRWTTRLAVAQKRNISENLTIDTQDRKLQVEGEVRQSYGDYQTALRQLASSKKGLEAAQKAYEVTQGRYEVGAASFVDLITAQVALVQAEASRAQSLIGFMLQGKTLEFALGR